MDNSIFIRFASVNITSQVVNPHIDFTQLKGYNCISFCLL